MSKLVLTLPGNLYSRYFIEMDRGYTPEMSYDLPADAVVTGYMIEDPLLPVKMKLNTGSILYVKGMFIEETRSYTTGSPIPPIPSPSGSITYDDYESYIPLALLNGLNSGSNEWANITPLTNYAARIIFFGIKSWDNFDSYTPGASLNLFLIGSGSGAWVGNNYYGRGTFIGIKNQDNFITYVAGANISGSSGGSDWTTIWDGRSMYSGIQAFDNFELYSAGADLDGSNAYPYGQYVKFSGPWSGRTLVTS